MLKSRLRKTEEKELPRLHSEHLQYKQDCIFQQDGLV